MRKDEIPSFVSELIDAGAPICAVGRELYVIGDIDLPDAQAEVVWEICNRYGERDHLILEIVAYLRSVGRFLDLSREALH
ncbi:MAG: hypothetical protein O9256_03265 [Rhizobiaceae bacterium]|nr:hypothetical protein [Rhizobiaceae bacterium]MCZ8352665.1 hypothetical protein [Rhizobium sp.]